VAPHDKVSVPSLARENNAGWPEKLLSLRDMVLGLARLENCTPCMGIVEAPGGASGCRNRKKANVRSDRKRMLFSAIERGQLARPLLDGNHALPKVQGELEHISSGVFSH